jgi:hypothetical protein
LALSLLSNCINRRQHNVSSTNQPGSNPLFRRILVWAPIVAMPFVLNLCWSEIEWPTVHPKWAVFILMGLILAVAADTDCHLRCRDHIPEQPTPNCRQGISLVGLASLLFLLGLAAGAVYALNIGEGLNRLTQWYAAAATLWCVILVTRTEPRFATYLQIGLCVSSLVLCLHFWYAFFFRFGQPDYDKFVRFSLIGHFNYTADVLVSLIPLLAWTTLAPNNPALRWIAGFSLLSTSAMMIMSGSLGGMGGLAIGGIAAITLYLAHRHSARPADVTGSGIPLKSSRHLWLAVGLMIAVILGAKPIMDHLPKEYRTQMFTRAIWWGAPKSVDLSKPEQLPPLARAWVALMPALGARTAIWASTSGMLAARPWLGFGTGSYIYEYPAFQKKYPLFRDPETLGENIKTNPHNALLHIAAENGLPMAMLFAGLFGWLMWRVSIQAWQKPDALWLSGVWALWAVALDALFNQVFYSPASLFMAAVICGFLVGHLPKQGALWPGRACRFWQWRLTPWLVAALALALCTVPARWLASAYYIAQATKPVANPSLLTTARQTKDLKAARDIAPWNVETAYALAMFNYRAGKMQQAEQYLQDYMKLSPHRSVVLNMLASIQVRQGRLDEAEANLEKALSLEPDAKGVKQNLDELRYQRQKRQEKKSSPSP